MLTRVTFRAYDEAMSLHAHFECYSVDCDGPQSRGYVMAMTEEEVTSDSGDLDFHYRVVNAVVNTYALFIEGSLKVTNEEDNGIRLVWSEATEEGGRSVEALICDDGACEDTPAWYRDHSAEAAGY